MIEPTMTLRERAAAAIAVREQQDAERQLESQKANRAMLARTLQQEVKRVLGIQLDDSAIEGAGGDVFAIIDDIRLHVGDYGYLVASRPCETSGCLNAVRSHTISTLADLGRWLDGQHSYHVHYFGEEASVLDEPAEPVTPAHPETRARDNAFSLIQNEHHSAEWGLTKLEYYAGVALQGLLAYPGELATRGDFTLEDLAVRSAYRTIAALNNPKNAEEAAS